ncbi:hypothetical protein BDD12DRAFT_804629 [Trichophaea hybrida]|nr:hypothetical protein BDD12DRAFT_804629 [Trichophaea hybrida]
MHPNNWRSAFLRALSISFKPAREIESIYTTVLPTDNARLAMLRTIILDPASFTVTRVLPGFPTNLVVNHFLATLTCGVLRDSSHSSPTARSSAFSISNHPRLVNSPHTLAFTIAVALPKPPSPHTSSPLHRVITRRQNCAKNPLRSPAFSRPAGCGQEPQSTSRIPLSYLDAVEARREAPGITVSWQEFDATDNRAMVELAEVLLRLVLTLVMMVIEAAGGEEGAKTLMLEENDRQQREWMKMLEEAKREEKKRCAERKKRRKRENGRMVEKEGLWRRRGW